MNKNRKPIDPIPYMRNNNALPKAVKDYQNLIILKGRMTGKSTSNKFLSVYGKMVEGTGKIPRLTKEIKVKSKPRKRSKKANK